MLRYTKFFIIIAAVIIGALWGSYFLIHKPKPAANPPPAVQPHQALGFHQSYFSQPEFFDKAFQTASLTPIKPDQSVSGIVVNHHLLAGAFIAETMGVVVSNEPTTVILVSPNHFSVGTDNIISSLYDWQTPYGVLPAKQDAIRQLQKQGVSIEEYPFEKEHGISGIVPFIKKLMPQASVIPIILKDKTTSDEIDNLNHTIAAATSGRVIMVASVDFSHYLPAPVADFHDMLSKHILRTFDWDEVGRLEVDSRPSIRLLLNYMTARKTEKFTLTNHSNSSVVLNDFSITNGTSYITGYFSPGDRAKDEHKTIIVTGAINSSPALAKILDKNKGNYIFSSVVRMFPGSDQTFVRVVGDDQDLASHLIKQGVTDIETGSVISSDTHIAKPFTIIPLDAKADFISDVSGKIVSIDWQGVNHAQQQKISRSLIDAGAILVIGQSSQILPVEQYGKGLIAYGLGDMIPANLAISTQSAALGIDVDDTGISYNFFPMEYREGKATFLKPKESDIVKAKLHLKDVAIKIGY